MSDQTSNTPKVDADEILEGIRTWVEIESPSNDGEAVNRMVDKVETDMQAIGAEINRTPGRDGFGDILTTSTPWGGDEPGILVLSHYAYRHLVRQGKQTPLPITFMFVPEEEVGSPTSQAAIEAAARANKYVLVTEPAREGGKIVTGRRGSARFKITVSGVPAHSGLRHQDGRSAIKEMAQHILWIEGLTDYERNVTTNVGLISGGTGTNVVPSECTVEVDMRLPDMEAVDEFVEPVLNLKNIDPDCTVTVKGGLNRPPYHKDEGITALYEHAKGLAEDIGFNLEDMYTGGGSDGNFTAALGVPTLDGLGADGRGAHAHDEQIYFSSLEPRTALWIRLFETLK